MKRVSVAPALAAVVLGALLSLGRGQSRNEVLQKAGLSADVRAAILTVGDDVRKLDKSHEAYVRAANEIDGLIAKLLQKTREVSRLAGEVHKSPSTGAAKLVEASLEMGEMSQSFNTQYLDLQQQMQDENRRFTLVSNIMKTKHDTAKNAINNVR